MKIALFVIIGVVLLLAVFYLYLNERQPTSLGVREGKFAPCPLRPNCVSSQSKQPNQHIAPIPYQGKENPIPILAQVIQKNFPSARIVIQENDYLLVEFRSQWFKFVDDTEFYYDTPKGVIHIRSAARVGYYDFDVNRKRAEEIRTLFEKRN